jgi:hypothetical protein
MCVIGCPARDTLLEKQYLSKSAIIAGGGGGGRNEEQGEMKTEYWYAPAALAARRGVAAQRAPSLTSLTYWPT